MISYHEGKFPQIHKVRPYFHIQLQIQHEIGMYLFANVGVTAELSIVVLVLVYKPKWY